MGGTIRRRNPQRGGEDQIFHQPHQKIVAKVTMTPAQ
jgi:hypothetical protein